MIVFRDARAHMESDTQQVKSFWVLLGPAERLAEKDNSTMCFLQLQADLLWILQSQLDRARNDAAAYKRRCFKQNLQMQTSEQNLLELQQNVKLAKSQMTSLQSSSMAAESETRQLKLSKHRVDKDLQASKVPYTRSSFCADLFCCNVSGCTALLAHTAHDRTVCCSDVLM